MSEAFKSQVKMVSEEMHGLVHKEFTMKEANLFSKMDNCKQEYLIAMNNNMKKLDNLINDYTTRTQKEIKTELGKRSCSSASRKIPTSFQLKSQNGDSGVEDINSLQESIKTE